MCHRKVKTAVSLTGCYDRLYDSSCPGLPAPGRPFWRLCRHFFPSGGPLVPQGPARTSRLAGRERHRGRLAGNCRCPRSDLPVDCAATCKGCMGKAAVASGFCRRKKSAMKTILSHAGRLLYFLMGWRLEPLPSYVSAKHVIIGFPHTSNIDTVRAFTGFRIIKRTAASSIKKESFFWPLSIVLHALGGIPVDRKAPQGAVEQMVDVFQLARRVSPGHRARGHTQKNTHDQNRILAHSPGAPGYPSSAGIWTTNIKQLDGSARLSPGKTKWRT